MTKFFIFCNHHNRITSFYYVLSVDGKKSSKKTLDCTTTNLILLHFASRGRERERENCRGKAAVRSRAPVHFPLFHTIPHKRVGPGDNWWQTVGIFLSPLLSLSCIAAVKNACLQARRTTFAKLVVMGFIIFLRRAL